MVSGTTIILESDICSQTWHSPHGGGDQGGSCLCTACLRELAFDLGHTSNLAFICLSSCTLYCFYCPYNDALVPVVSGNGPLSPQNLLMIKSVSSTLNVQTHIYCHCPCMDMAYGPESSLLGEREPTSSYWFLQNLTCVSN